MLLSDTDGRGGDLREVALADRVLGYDAARSDGLRLAASERIRRPATPGQNR